MKKFKILTLSLCLCLALGGCSFLSSFSSNTETTAETEQTTEPTEYAPQNDGRTLYGYNSLSDNGTRLLYAEIEKNIDAVSPRELSVSGKLTVKQMFEAVAAYKEDNPEKFWFNDIDTYYYDGENNVTGVNLSYSMENAELIEAKKTFSEKLDEIVSQIPDGVSEFEKEIFIHNYIIDNCAYDEESAQNKEILDSASNAYGALAEGKAVCEGYARAFQLLCNEAGIECVNISGTSKDENHMWNAVKIGGEWYNIDVTWDDSDGENLEIARYIYFNIDNEQIGKDHSAAPLYSELSEEDFEAEPTNANFCLPDCNADEYNYCLYYGALITDIDDDSQAVEAIAQAAAEGRELFYLIIDSALDFDDTSYALIYEGYVAKWIESANFKNAYSPNINAKAKVYTIENRNMLVVALEA